MIPFNVGPEVLDVVLIAWQPAQLESNTRSPCDALADRFAAGAGAAAAAATERMAYRPATAAARSSGDISSVRRCWRRTSRYGSRPARSALRRMRTVGRSVKRAMRP